ncbi:MAG: chromosome segregation protein SMC [Gammaproteobacteria bacterium]|nr:chromosome segregation protein SMC [Gammaproteobacteria bacterium]MBU2057370.1 chromosome segregation protein SMC [Gammaproteobacteria bacterium]MBU2176062.1 chromosome segregation protein SMC [Gammaproteobacteria bacterium]MBU2245242.1 chromosome segregation protein SMC [Gammaproteobacteria bacterium]MBU2395648.1 chromosome segregation protein SMC [Gammaproteobacteria bacterium]
MRLKQIKLAGFKSFVDPTQVAFPAAMTAVVGPNGCGKSNVIDAVRWVLGESSAKNLRGDAMTDVIFNGSTQRKPVSQASVELMFENTQGRLQGTLADRSEIAIKRLVTRDGQSNYFLNGTKCRRRDITDIFLGTGLGPRSYAIIEQGMISRLIESKPADLRIFIEEAAGISKYKERRRETENRIKHTRENLDRLSDVREELGKNLDKLKRQAAAAARFKELKAQERKLKAELACVKWLHFHGLLQKTELDIQHKLTEIEQFQAAQSGDQLLVLQLKEQQQDLRTEQQQVQQQYYQVGNQITRLEQQQLHQRQRRQSLTDELRSLQLTLQDADSYMAQQREQLAELEFQLETAAPDSELKQEQFESLTEQAEQAQEQLLQAQSALQQWQQQFFALQQQQQQNKLKTEHSQQQQQQLLNRISQLQQELAQLDLVADSKATQPLLAKQQETQQQLEVVGQQSTEMELRYQALQQGQQERKQQQLVRQSELKQLKNQQDKLSQIQQQVNQQQQQLLKQLEIEPQWAKAVSLVLGELQHATAEQGAKEGTEQSYVSPCQLEAKAGTLAAVIRSGLYPDSFHTVLLAANTEQAQAKQQQLQPQQSVICPEGIWFGSNWQLVPGQAASDNYLTRQQQLLELAEQIRQLEQLLLADQQQEAQSDAELASSKQQWQQSLAQLQQAKDQLQNISTDLLLLQQQQQLQQQRRLQASSELTTQQQDFELLSLQLDELEQESEALDEQYQSQKAKEWQLQQQLSQCQQQHQHLKQQQDLIRQQLQQVQLEQQSAQKQLSFSQQNLQRSQQQQQQLQQRHQLVQEQLAEVSEPDGEQHETLQLMLEQRAEVELLVQQKAEALHALDEKLRQAEQGHQGVAHVLTQKQKELADLQLSAEGYRVRANNMLEQLTELQVNFKELSETLPPEANEQEWQQQLEKTQDSVSRLGPINLAAIEEFEQQDERKQYLDAQHQDLVSALETLETAIRKIDRETRQKFKETFEQVNDGLQTLFPKVFGGGSAYLDLTEEDLLETGVTIMARPPGKKNSTIHLLSGGEKALTALSLVFSIFRLNPAPFCMLDEVDAPLDDANVGRFCNLVREMSETVQFIYISHNKIAMEMAAQLMGVTMQEPGVSRVVAVDVEDAVKMAQA